MDATDTSRANEQARDLAGVARHWRKIGHTPESIRKYCSSIKHILRIASASDYQELCAEGVARLAYAQAKRRHINARGLCRRWLSAFRAFGWGLQQLGIPVGSLNLPKAKLRRDPVIAEFVEYGQKLGWAKHTLHTRERYLCNLRAFLIKHHAPWPVPRLKDIDHFLQDAAGRWKRVTVGGAASTFRAWLRFLFITGYSRHNLDSSVALPPSITYPQPARALPWRTIRQLRRGIDSTAPVGLRDAAQYLLLCAYGLSSAEVINLQLQDIDWHAGTLHIRRVKTGAAIDLPLSPAVAKAIAAYLRHGRPPTCCRHVFVRHTIPFGPLSHSAVGQRVKHWAQSAETEVTIQGTHVIRHSFATRQLELGTPLKVIGDILGHRHSQTTGIYTRSALVRLRPLALKVPK
jgi:site-specific recombinase XerD